jgi:ABC-2 type transport system permease protein
MTHFEMWIAFQTILRKEIRRYMRIWPQTLLPPAITMTLYFVIFGSLIGSRIGSMGGFSYMQFVVPGLIMMAVVTNSYSNIVSSFFGAKYNHSVQELLVSPVPNWIILAGFVIGSVSRGLLIAVIVTGLSLFFADLSVQHLGATILVVVMTSILFSLFGFINAVFARNFDDISIVPTFILTPLIYLGGVFYSLDLLPEFWANLSKLNPLVYVVNGFRYGVLGVSDVNVGFSLGMITLFTLVTFFYCLHLLNSGTRLRE